MTDFNYFFVLDFEATCSDTDPNFKSEIIEFPIVVLEKQTGNILCEFRRYVKPTINTTLTNFCTTLTGISQETVDKADTFTSVWEEVQKFINDFVEKYDANGKFLFATCGDWDLQRMLVDQARISKIKVPSYFHRWINIKFPFRNYKKDFLGGKSGGFGMTTMLQELDLPLVGRHHSGLDDSRNIAAIIKKLIEKNVTIDFTTEWSDKLKRTLAK